MSTGRGRPQQLNILSATHVCVWQRSGELNFLMVATNVVAVVVMVTGLIASVVVKRWARAHYMWPTVHPMTKDGLRIFLGLRPSFAPKKGSTSKPAATAKPQDDTSRPPLVTLPSSLALRTTSWSAKVSPGPRAETPEGSPAASKYLAPPQSRVLALGEPTLLMGDSTPNARRHGRVSPLLDKPKHAGVDSDA